MVVRWDENVRPAPGSGDPKQSQEGQEMHTCSHDPGLHGLLQACTAISEDAVQRAGGMDIWSASMEENPLLHLGLFRCN